MTWPLDWYPVMVTVPNHTNEEGVLQGMSTRAENLGGWLRILMIITVTRDKNATRKMHWYVSYPLVKLFPWKSSWVKCVRLHLRWIIHQFRACPSPRLYSRRARLSCETFRSSNTKAQRSLIPPHSQSRLLSIRCGSAGCWNRTHYSQQLWDFGAVNGIEHRS